MSTRRALIFSYIDRYASLVIFTLASMVIARLLTPAQVGVYSITMVMVGFVGPFRDLGASQYLIYEKDLTPDRIRSVWAIQLGLSVVLALLIFGLRDLAAEFYREPQIRDIMAVSSLHALLVPFGALTSAWLTRELRFEYLAIIRFSGVLAGSLGSIFLAWWGFGAISLAWGALISAAVGAVVSVFFRPRHFPWMPGIREIRRVLGFGSVISGITLLGVAYSGVAELMLGRIQGMYVTGMYARAQGLVALFERLIIDAVHAVALPSFSRLKNEGQPLDIPFIRATTLIVALGWSMLGYLSLMSYPMIHLLYGAQWGDSVDLARQLCIGMAFMLTSSLCPALLIASGYRWVALWLSVLNVLVQAMAALIGATHGLESLGYTLMVASLILSAMWLYVSHRLCQFSFKHFAREQMRSLIVVSATMLPPVLTVAMLGLRPQETFAPMLMSAAASAGMMLLVARLTRHPVWAEMGVLLLRRRISRLT